MQHLQRGAQVFDTRRKRTSDHPPRFYAQNGPQALATGKNTVPHGPMYGNRMLCGRWQYAFQRGVSQLSACLQGVFEHDGEYSKRLLVFVVMIMHEKKKDARAGVLD